MFHFVDRMNKLEFSKGGKYSLFLKIYDDTMTKLGIPQGS